MRLADSQSATLSVLATACPPFALISSATFCAGPALPPSPPTEVQRSFTTTFAPCAAKASAKSRPMPPPAPVTSTILSFTIPLSLFARVRVRKTLTEICAPPDGARLADNYTARRATRVECFCRPRSAHREVALNRAQHSFASPARPDRFVCLVSAARDVAELIDAVRDYLADWPAGEGGPPPAAAP